MMRILGRTQGVQRVQRSRRSVSVAAQSSSQSITLTRPDDMHLHVRDGTGLQSVVPFTARQFGRALIMPNLKPPITSAAQATKYAAAIRAAAPPSIAFQPLMTCYLTDRTTPDDIAAAKAAGVVAFKLYPAGATTNSDAGVTATRNVERTLLTMAELGMVLCVHGEVTESHVDVFDRERVFLDRILSPMLERAPQLRVVLEHITTRDAADFVMRNGDRGSMTSPPNLAATITPQHMLLNRNALFQGGMRPHCYCLPILKREVHREAVAAAAVSGDPRFFLGTDSAPHPRGAKESSCGCAGIFSAPHALELYATAFETEGKIDKLDAFASQFGAEFYKLPRNKGTITLKRETWRIPEEVKFGDTVVVPMWAGQELHWKAAV